jgi:predicted GNAT family acetyltransferase
MRPPAVSRGCLGADWRMTTRELTESNLPAAVAFLERYVETSIFLLAGLRRYGPRLGPHQNSGHYRLIEDGGSVVAVYCPTRRGHLLVQTGGRRDLAEDILRVAAADTHGVRGVAAEWRAAESIWQALTSLPESPRPSDAYRARHVVYRLDLSRPADAGAPVGVRPLTRDDFDRWDELNMALLGERNAGALASSVERRREGFVHRVDAGHAWGAFEGQLLVSIAVLDEHDGPAAQIGGLYTRADWRGRGFGRLTMEAVLRDAAALGFRTVCLFTEEDNVAARALYESLGFTRAGEFGFFVAAV